MYVESVVKCIATGLMLAADAPARHINCTGTVVVTVCDPSAALMYV